MPDHFEETLRFPSNLDRAGIESRLVEVHTAALAEGLPDVAALLVNLSALTAGQLGAKVVAALNLMQEKPEHRKIATQLEIVAMNLKNLK